MFLEQVQSVARRVEDLSTTLRELTPTERSALEQSGNIISGRILVSNVICLSGIRNNVFLGTVVLNNFSHNSVFWGPETPELRACITGSTLSDTVVDGASFIKDCAMIHSTYIAGGCVLISNGILSGNFGRNLFGIGTEIVLCEETGTRSIISNPETCDLESVVTGIQSRSSRAAFNDAARAFKLRMEGVRGCPGLVLNGGVKILKSSKVDSCWLECGVSITGAEISDSIVSQKSRIDNSIVEKAILGRSVEVTGFSVIEYSILSDLTKVSIHGKVVHSLVGSYSGVESGECVSSLLGPFVGFHHQSLCIATYWPAGKGNIGYGANVGSNHSGKAPDCELIAGEGIFFGLATVIKFPCNFENAPYSLIASGVICLPQKLEMPFSLINTGSTNALNEISPGWVLSDNMFTLLRNQDKFAKRQKKEATVVYDHEVFRSDIMDLIVVARNRLMSVSGDKDTVYTENEIAGLGKNFLRESTRLRAIDTYGFVLRWYGLRGLYRRVEDRGLDAVVSEIENLELPKNNAKSFTKISSRNPEEEFKHCMQILRMEEMNLKEIKSLLAEFSKLDFLMSANCVSSKTKDDVRGAKIVGNLYQEFHQPASQHAVCVKAKKNSAEIEQVVRKIVSKL
jgi:hypothetical protein